MHGWIVGLPLSPESLFLLSSTSLYHNPCRIKPLLPHCLLFPLHASCSLSPYKHANTIFLSLWPSSSLYRSLTHCLSTLSFLSSCFSLFFSLNLSCQALTCCFVFSMLSLNLPHYYYYYYYF